MGYPMAVNLRSKMDDDQTLLICDLSEEATTKFQSQMYGKGPVEVVKTGYEAALQAVCKSRRLFF
jgi:3-hydroxyisobutyrate dehydrogenase